MCLHVPTLGSISHWGKQHFLKGYWGAWRVVICLNLAQSTSCQFSLGLRSWEVSTLMALTRKLLKTWTEHGKATAGPWIHSQSRFQGNPWRIDGELIFWSSGPKKEKCGWGKESHMQNTIISTFASFIKGWVQDLPTQWHKFQYLIFGIRCGSFQRILLCWPSPGTWLTLHIFW